MLQKKILVLGPFGAFGRRVATALAAIPQVACQLGADATNSAARIAHELGATTVPADVHDPASLERALADVFAVVNTCGPFLEADSAVAGLCAERGVHYVDPADAHDHVGNIARLGRKAEKSGSLLVTGAAAVPAVSAVLVDMLMRDFDRIREIHTCLLPGTRDWRELSTVRSILGHAVSPARTKERGRWRAFYPWTDPETVRFPKPVGKRRVYLCDSPDLDLFPRRYGAQTVTFRTGLPWRGLNLALSFLGWLKRRGLLANVPAPLAAVIRASSRLPSLGHAGGGLGVEVHGEKRGRELTHTAYLIARDGGGAAIAAAPMLALVRKWVTHGVPVAGAMPCVGMFGWEELRNELLGHDVVLVRV